MSEQIVVAEIEAYDPAIYGSRTLRFSTEGFATGGAPLGDPTLDARLTVTRAGEATRINSQGLVEVVGANRPRWNYDPVTKALKGLLIEQTKTNLLTYSAQFDNAAWGKTQVSVGSNAAIAPDGTLTADEILPNAGSAVKFVGQTLSSFAASTAYTFSVYAKISNVLTNPPGIALRMRNSTATSVVYANYDLVLGTATAAVANADFSNSTASITNVGNGWYRCTISATVVNSLTNPAVEVFYGAYQTVTDVGDVFIWGAQLEVGAGPATSYIPTVASAVTRNVDLITMTGANFTPWYNNTEGTLYCEWEQQHTNITVPVGITDGLTSNRFSIVGGPLVGGRITIASTTTTPGTVSVSPGVQRAALAFKSGDSAMAVNGQSAGTFAPGGVSGWSGFFDGSGDYLTSPYNSAFLLNGDFTLECWVYPTTATGRRTLINRSAQSGVQFSSYELVLESDGKVCLQQGSGLTTTGTQAILTTTATVSANTWTHIAAVKSGSTNKIYINGVESASGASGTVDQNTSAVLSIGIRLLSNDQPFTGRLSNVRIVKGSALYTSNFTPSTTSLTAVAGTSLLTCQSSTFVDNSGNNFTINVIGNATPQQVSPFPPFTFPAVNRADFGVQDSALTPTAVLNGHLRRVMYWPTRLTNTELLQLTSGQLVPDSMRMNLELVGGANSYYESRITVPPSVQRECFRGGRTFGQSQIGFGDMVLVNNDGGLDYMLEYSYAGRRITIRLGTLQKDGVTRTWTTILVGSMEQVELSWQKVTVRVRDRLLDLAKPLQQVRYAGGNALPAGLEGNDNDLKGRPKPLIYGRVFNITPPMVNTTRLIYQVHTGGQVVAVNGVYDRGVLMTAGAAYTSQADMEANAPAAGQYRVWNDATLGCFIRVASNPTGTLTADVTQGASRTVGQLFQAILTKAGLSTSDINTADITALDTEVNYEVGVYAGPDQDVSALQLLDELCASVGAWYGTDINGVFRIGRIALPTGTSLGTITALQIIKIERVASRDPGVGVPSWKVKLGWQKVQTVQTDLAAGVGADRKALVAETYRRQEVSDESVKVANLLSPEIEFDTVLTDKANALAEANRRLTIYKARRDIYQVTVRVDAQLAPILDLGNIITLQINRFGMNAGKKFLIIGVKSNMRGYLFDLTLWG